MTVKTIVGVSTEKSNRDYTLHINGQKFVFIHAFRKNPMGYKNTNKIDNLKRYWDSRGFNLRVIDRGRTYDIYVAKKKAGASDKAPGAQKPGKKSGISIGAGVGKVKGIF